MYRNKITLAFTGLLFFSFLSWNCTKIDTTSIGSGLIPAVDNVNTFEQTLDVIANNVDTTKDCATVTYNQDQALGVINNDPYFGKTTATIYAELEPESFPTAFLGSVPTRILDSIVLVLSVKGTFGDSTIAQKVNVFQLAYPFVPDTSTCNTYSHNIGTLGSAIYTPSHALTDTARSYQDTAAGQLRIKLNNSFGLSLLKRDSLWLQSDSAFRTVFAGFAIVPDTTSFGGNALTYISIVDVNTKLAFYYRYTDPLTSSPDTAVEYYKLATATPGSANYITRNRSTAEISQHTTFKQTGESVIYIQTTPGTYADIQIPALSGLSNRIIHRAELIMDQVYEPFSVSKNDVMNAPGQLFLDLKDTSGKFKPIPCDFNTLSGAPNTATFGGFKTMVKDPFGNDIARYTFDISRYVQKIVNKVITKNASMRLRAPDFFDNMTAFVDECNQGVSVLSSLLNTIANGRVKLGGGNNPNYKMRLHIVYSNL